ncbi:MAG: hypothetical protein OIF40_13235 [Mangrovicoccus sp.]|nr:hypothetical protein [Mangrovicoccus sp.]
MGGQVHSPSKLHAALAALEHRALDTQHVFENTGSSAEDMTRDDLRVSLHQILQAALLHKSRFGFTF